MAVTGLSGGSALERRLAEIAEGVTKKAEVRVGFLEGATYPDGTSVPMVAAIQEFGAPDAGIPPRPYFRSMIAEKSGTWGDATAAALRANGYDAAKTLAMVGQVIEGQLRASIRDVTDPPLSPVTLLLRQRFGNAPERIKGADVVKAREDVASGTVPTVSGTGAKPLVWTGNLLHSVASEVRE